jgi:hypothetical protein
MLQRPTALGLILCQQVIVESRTHHMTLVNTLTHLRWPTFPSPPQKYIAYAVLTDGIGGDLCPGSHADGHAGRGGNLSLVAAFS